MWTKVVSLVLLPLGRWLWREILEELAERKAKDTHSAELVAKVKAEVISELKAEGWAPKTDRA